MNTSSPEGQNADALSLYELLNGPDLEFNEFEPRFSEKNFENEVFQFLKSHVHADWQKQKAKEGDIRVDALGAKHKPDGIYKKRIALEIKKIAGIGGITHSIQRAIGQALVYRAKYEGVVLLLLDFTGSIDAALKKAEIAPEGEYIVDSTKSCLVLLKSLNIYVVVKSPITTKIKKKPKKKQ